MASQGWRGYREIANQVTPGATPDQTSTDHANGLLSFVVDSDVLLHAYLKMTDCWTGADVRRWTRAVDVQLT